MTSRRLRMALAVLVVLVLAMPALAASRPAEPGAGPGEGFVSSMLDAVRDRWRQLVDHPLVKPLQLSAGLSAKWLSVTKAAVAFLGAALLVWELIARRAGLPQRGRRARDGLLLGLGLLAGLCWWDLFGFGSRSYVHTWELYHYYLGAKYQSELGYDRLYACTTVADAEDGLHQEVRRRLIRDLDTKRLVRTTEVLGSPERCTSAFTPERWAMFKRDVAWFRNHLSPKLWDMILHDHGYNGTPAWAVMGALLASTGPASRAQLWLLVLIDPLLLVGMWLFAWWAFGWRATCVALLYWGTNYPAHFGWTGGSFLRQDWLVATVVGIGLLRKALAFGGGVALALAALLRVFPVVALAGVGLKAIGRIVRARRLVLVTSHRSLGVGALVTVLLLVPLAAWTGGGWTIWGLFADNVWKHSNVLAVNQVGLRTVVAYDHESRAARTAALGLEEDDYQVWKTIREQQFHARRYAFVAVVLLFLGLLAWAVTRQPDWVAAILGISLVPILSTPSCYYFSIFLVFGFIGWRREVIGIALSVLAGSTALLPLFLGAREEEQLYLIVSALMVGFVFVVTVLCAWTPLPEERPASS